MKITVEHQNKTYQVDLSQPIDITLPLQPAENAASAWYCSKSHLPIRNDANG